MPRTRYTSVANLGNLLFTSTGAIGIPIGIIMLFALNPDFRRFLVKLINFDGFWLNCIRQNINLDHGNFFSQNPKPFRQYVQYNLLGTAQNHLQKSPRTSDSWNTEILRIRIAISTNTCRFELRYKGRRTRNTQVCRHKITAYVYLSYMSSCARPISEKLLFEPFLKSGFSVFLLI